MVVRQNALLALVLIGLGFRLVPATLAAAPLAPQVLSGFHLPPPLTITGAARPGLIEHPLAIDWSPDSRLYVAELTAESNSSPEAKERSRIKVLTDLDQDGQYDQATLFLDSLPLISSVKTWRNGLLIAAAPDLIYAEDTDGDGQADEASRLIAGFGCESPQHRFNSLQLGQDGWIYGANGWADGALRAAGGLDAGSSLTPIIDITGQDFRFRLRPLRLEPAAGYSQFARTENDTGESFGCDSRTPLWHYPFPLHNARRNPEATYPDPSSLILSAETLTTSAGIAKAGAADARLWTDITFYRDNCLGREYEGNLFIADPLQGAVHQVELRPVGLGYTARVHTHGHPDRPFLSSDQPTFRPFKICTGPDGALWIIDPGDAPILPEHPGSSATVTSTPGGLFRVYRPGQVRPLRDLTAFTPGALARALTTPNGPQRDRIQAVLTHRIDPEARLHLRSLAFESDLTNTAIRRQALRMLNENRALSPSDLLSGLQDPEPSIRRQALRLWEPHSFDEAEIPSAISRLVEDPDVRVQYELALTLGKSRAPTTPSLLASLLVDHPENVWMHAAVLSSAQPCAGELLAAIFDRSPLPSPSMRAFVTRLVQAALNDPTGPRPERLATVCLNSVALGSTSLRQVAVAEILEQSRPPSSPLVPDPPLVDALAPLLAEARALGSKPHAPPSTRADAVRLLGWQPAHWDRDLETLLTLLTQEPHPELRAAAARVLVRSPSPDTAYALVSIWTTIPPSLRPEILGAFLRHETWTDILLTAVDKGFVSAPEITPANRQRLLNHPEPELRGRAEMVFREALPPLRQPAFDRYAPALRLRGNSDPGRAVFESRCQLCHAFNNVGPQVGPDLAGIGQRTPGQLLNAILSPSQSIEPRYRSYQVDTTDGRSLTGVLEIAAGESLIVRQPGGHPVQLPPRAVRYVRASNLSLMPEGIEAGLTPQAMADLLAFLLHNTTQTSTGRTPEP